MGVDLKKFQSRIFLAQEYLLNIVLCPELLRWGRGRGLRVMYFVYPSARYVEVRRKARRSSAGALGGAIGRQVLGFIYISRHFFRVTGSASVQ